MLLVGMYTGTRSINVRVSLIQRDSTRSSQVESTVNILITFLSLIKFTEGRTNTLRNLYNDMTDNNL